MLLKMEFVIRYGLACMATLKKEGEHAYDNSGNVLHAFGVF